MSSPIYAIGNVYADRYLHWDHEDWDNFAEFWNDLPLDGYMGDGGTYRRRKFSTVSYDVSDQSIRVHSESGFLQSREINPLNGGVIRKFQPLDSALPQSTVARQLLAHFAARAVQPETPVRTVNIHQHRITATETESGRPTPEGVHRDGVRHVVMVLVARENVIGGMSTLYDNAGTPVLTHTLANPGDYIFLDDRTCMHSASPVAVAGPAVTGHRDMLFFEFC